MRTRNFIWKCHVVCWSLLVLLLLLFACTGTLGSLPAGALKFFAVLPRTVSGWKGCTVRGAFRRQVFIKAGRKEGKTAIRSCRNPPSYAHTHTQTTTQTSNRTVAVCGSVMMSLYTQG